MRPWQIIRGALAMTALAIVVAPHAEARPFANTLQQSGVLFRSRVDADSGVAIPLPISPALHVTGNPVTLHAAHDVIHPVLRKWLQDSLPTLRKDLRVVFRDSLRDAGAIPTPIVRLSRGLPVTLPPIPPQIAAILQLRKGAYAAESTLVASSFGATVLPRRDWLIQALDVRMDLRMVDSLAMIAAVQSIAPLRAGEAAPKCPRPQRSSADVIVARRHMGSVAWSGLDLPTPPIGIVDTGVFWGHAVFGPDRFRYLGDCVATADCDGDGQHPPDPNDVCTGDGHGSCTAAILVAGNALGPRFVGMTQDPIASYRVYDNCGDADHDAVRDGIARSISHLDQVTLVETQIQGDELDDACEEAAAAYDHGQVVIATKGDGMLGSPALSHLVLAIDGWDLFDNGFMDTNGSGRTLDQRIKPDLIAPTGTVTISGPLNEPDPECEVGEGFGGSSGAAPYAAGAAALMLAWLEKAAGTVDPGQVYAALLAAANFHGRQTAIDLSAGAGEVHLPETTADIQFARLAVSEDLDDEIPITVTGGSRTVDAAIWWPEYPYADGSQILVDHDDLGLQLVQSEKIVQQVDDSGSVFQKLHARLTPGHWIVRVVHHPLHASPRPAYVAVILHPE